MIEEKATPALRQLLAELPAAYPLERLETLWLFVPRDIAGREHGLVVLAVRDPEQHPEDGLLEIVTWEYQVERDRKGERRVDTVTRQGWAPADRASRVAHGVLARMRDETEALHEESVRGDPDRWSALLARFSVDPPNPE